MLNHVKLTIVLLIHSFILYGQKIITEPIDIYGKTLIEMLDDSHVDKLWQRGFHIDWETGQSLREAQKINTTHCSAFAASFAKNVGIYLLRPPRHVAKLLANAQYDWLQTKEAMGLGWVKAGSALEAQNLANKGFLVLVVYKNRNDLKPGHIAVVRPSEKNEQELSKDGPQIAQAGFINFTSGTVKEGFFKHPDAWPNGVDFYWHKINWVEVKKGL